MIGGGREAYTRDPSLSTCSPRSTRQDDIYGHSRLLAAEKSKLVLKAILLVCSPQNKEEPKRRPVCGVAIFFTAPESKLTHNAVGLAKVTTEWRRTGLLRRERASARQVAAASSEKRKSLAESLAYSCSRCQWLVKRLAHSNPKRTAKDGILYL